jgi:O-antigen/teichoic acid export membrane protein
MKYLKNTSWLFGEKIVRMILGLFVGIWVARFLGPEEYGLFSYATSFVLLFTPFATLGLDGIVIRELVKKDTNQNELIATVFRLKLFGAIGVIIFLAFSVGFTTHNHYTNVLVFIIASGTIFQSFNVIDLYFQSKVMSKYIVYSNVISLVISSVLKVFLIYINASLFYFAWVVVFESFILALGLVFFFVKKNPEAVIQNLKFNAKVAFSILKDSWPLILVGVASLINMRIDQVLLGNMVGYKVVGNYAAAVRVAEIWLLLPVVIGQSVFPAIISAHKHSLELYRKRVFDTVKYMSYFAIPFAIIISLLSNSIMALLYGEQYKDAGLYLSFYIWTGLPYVVLFALSHVMLVENLAKWNLFTTIFSVTTNLILNYIIIPKYGGLGSISVTLIVTYLSQAISIVVLYKKTNIFKKQSQYYNQNKKQYENNKKSN